MSAPHEIEALSCQELVELVTAYLEGALPPEEHARVEEHLAAATRKLGAVNRTRAVAIAIRDRIIEP